MVDESPDRLEMRESLQALLGEAPTHPDWFKMLEVIQQNDQRTRSGHSDPSGRSGLGDTIQVDLGSLGYASNWRAREIQDELSNENLRSDTNDVDPNQEVTDEDWERQRLVMAWIDGFTAGQRFEQVKDMENPRHPDGNRRQRRGKRR